MNTEQTTHKPLNEELQALEQQNEQELKPIENSNRIHSMDILRGFALIGIILMNIEWFNRSIIDIGRFDYALTDFDWSAGWTIRWLVEGKFYKLFSLLFGMGFAVMLLRAQALGRPFNAWFSRRMLALFIFGMAHMVFLWGGDILHDYAVGGFLLLGWMYLLKFKWMQWANNTNMFLKVGLVILFLPYVIFVSVGSYFGNTRDDDVMMNSFDERTAVYEQVERIKQDPVLAAELKAVALAEKNGTQERPEVDKDAMDEQALIVHNGQRRFISEHKRHLRKQEERQALGEGSYWQATVYRSKEAVSGLKNTPIGAVLMSFPLFMIGYWFVASGAMRRPQEHKGLFKTMAWVGTGVGLAMGVVGVVGMSHPMGKYIIELRISSQLIFQFSQLFLTAGYLGMLVLACMTERGSRWLSWLGPMGRMALTNYITHSLILSSIFYGYAGGMYGEISRGSQVALVVVIIAAQAIISHMWLSQFKFGPLEWLWRSISYMKWQPISVAGNQVTGSNQQASVALGVKGHNSVNAH